MAGNPGTGDRPHSQSLDRLSELSFKSETMKEQDNIELIKLAYSAFKRGDLDGFALFPVSTCETESND
jgi:hypothetical protein